MATQPGWLAPHRRFSSHIGHPNDLIRSRTVALTHDRRLRGHGCRPSGGRRRTSAPKICAWRRGSGRPRSIGGLGIGGCTIVSQALPPGVGIAGGGARLDDGLGRSGSGLVERPGFQKLIVSACSGRARRGRLICMYLLWGARSTHDAACLQIMGDAQCHVLAPRRGDDLHADRHASRSGTGTATTGRPMNEIGCV